MRYILYARKSSEDKARQILSLESQIGTMQKLADDLGLHVVEVLSESKSAKKPDNRPVFAKMMKMLEQGKADGIVCWKLDRLSRNPVVIADEFNGSRNKGLSKIFKQLNVAISPMIMHSSSMSKVAWPISTFAISVKM